MPDWAQREGIKMDVNEKYLREDEREIGPRWKRNAFFLPPRAGTDIALLFARLCEARAEIEELKRSAGCSCLPSLPTSPDCKVHGMGGTSEG